jgi:hypothetical protein
MILIKSYELFLEIYLRDTIICYKFFRRVMRFIGDLSKGYYNMFISPFKIYDIDEIGSKGSIPVPFY